MALTLELLLARATTSRIPLLVDVGDAEMQRFSTKLGPLMTKTCKRGERMQLVSDITAVLPLRC